jgi:SAM-dependent methyltransferase
VRTALDFACGGGRHTALALSLGYSVTAADSDVSAVKAAFRSHPLFEPVEADLEAGSEWPWFKRRFDVVIVTNYLHRPRLPGLVAAVAADGLLIYETFAVGQERFGRPANPHFLLRPGELLEAVRDKLVPFAYEHIMAEGPKIVQRIAAVGPGHAWLTYPPAKENI